MAQMNIDLDKLGRIGQEDLKDEKTLKRIFQYLYQLSEQLKYWQYHMEEENMTEELQEKIRKASEKDVKTMSTTITDEGIMIKDREGNTVMTIGENGDMSLKSLTTQDLTVNGKSLGTVLEAFLDSKIVVSDTQPEGSGLIWIMPQSGGSTTARFSGNGNGQACVSGTPKAFYFARDTNAAEGITCSYGVRFRIKWGEIAGFVTGVKVQVGGAAYGGQVYTVTILNQQMDEYVAPYGYLTVDTLENMASNLTNVTYGPSLTVSITVSFDDDAEDRIFAAETFTVVAKADGQSGTAQDCLVKYIP
ncbi:MAG: hypothetical protein IKD95_02330 [Bacteroidales bacterium]|nr:hypothetical protein [Bacteroidales bacterium]